MAEAANWFQFFHWEYADEAKQDKVLQHYDIMMSEQRGGGNVTDPLFSVAGKVSVLTFDAK